MSIVTTAFTAGSRRSIRSSSATSSSTLPTSRRRSASTRAVAVAVPVSPASAGPVTRWNMGLWALFVTISWRQNRHSPSILRKSNS